MRRPATLPVLAAALLTATTTLIVPPPAPAKAQAKAAVLAAADYCLEQCSDILPPGQNGNATLVEILE